MTRSINRREFLRTAGMLTAASVGGSLLSQRASGQTIQRPITDFLNAVSKKVTYVPPISDFWGWFGAANREPRLNASVDYLGVANAYLKSATGGAIDLGTTVEGTLSEKPLGNGTRLFSVYLHTKNALSYAMNFVDPSNFASDPLVFGYHAAPTGLMPPGEPDVLNGATPALSECHFQLDIISLRPDSAIPDIFDLDSAVQSSFTLVTIGFRSNGIGPLRAISGISEGTPARLVISQTGVLKHWPASKNWDGFPAESITLHPVR